MSFISFAVFMEEGVYQEFDLELFEMLVIK